ncbi:hypothetical protein AWB85_14700 [Mycobacteroides immunogenum]|uniref:Lipoprotein LpqT n=1 Tax=Mycobacteroides immunogenum TaxID=83262 RepID=A0A179V5F0_9MYCO|nr:LpqN/LpqT family lipoprotein [Mycobacteroides immunogenum]OAT66877.1 hypothetical protein AWB85_14700 [Mycobacteroides immunogenum]
MRSAALAAAAVASFAMIGCGSQNPAQPAGSSSSTPESTAPAAKPISMNEYLHSIGIKVTPVSPESPANVRIDVPLPQGWESLGALDPAYLIADKPSGADQGRTPSAVAYLIKLEGPLDAREIITEHGFADAQNTQSFRKIASSLDDFQGYPSAAIEGTYDNQNVRVHAWNRDVIVPDGPLHYLVQFTVTTTEAQTSALSPDIAELTGGLKIITH